MAIKIADNRVLLITFKAHQEVKVISLNQLSMYLVRFGKVVYLRVWKMRAGLPVVV